MLLTKEAKLFIFASVYNKLHSTYFIRRFWEVSVLTNCNCLPGYNKKDNLSVESAMS